MCYIAYLNVLKLLWFNLGLTPKEEALLMEIRKRRSELMTEIQVLNCNLNISFNVIVVVVKMYLGTGSRVSQLNMQ